MKKHLILTAVVATFAACAPLPTVAPPTGAVSISVVLGDSNVWLSTNAIQTAFNVNGDGVTLNGQFGYGLCPTQLLPTPTFWTDYVTKNAQDTAVSRFVIQLGVNDAEGNDPSCLANDSYDTLIDNLVDAAGTIPVYWAGFRDDLPTCIQQVTGTTNLCDVLNSRLAAAQARHANLHYLDENAYFRGHGEWFGTCGATPEVSGLMYVHFNCPGQVEFANWLKAQTSP